MNRYLNSFFITFILYVGFGYGLFTIFADENIKVKETEPLKTISLNHIELKKEVPKVKEIIKPKEIVKPKKVEAKKIKPEKIIKKKKVVEKKKPKKKPVKKAVKKKEVKKVIEEVVKEPAVKQVEKPVQKIVEKKIEKKVIPTTQKKEVNVKQDYLRKHLLQIRTQIMKNVKYPKRAKRFNIQDVVKVKFTLLSNGKVENIKILNGNKHLHKSAINAIKKASKSFPKVSKNIDIVIPIEYKLI